MLKLHRTWNTLWKAMIVVWIGVLLAGCGTTGTQDDTTTIPTPTIALVPTEKDPTLMPTPSDPALQRLIEKAKTDLTGRLSVSATQIELVNATEVEWSDSSLGCPQPGMNYLQVITPGYQILLLVAGQQYDYHTNKQDLVVYCESSTLSPSP